MSEIVTLANKATAITDHDSCDYYVDTETKTRLRGITKRLKKRFYPRVKKVKTKKNGGRIDGNLPKGLKGGRIVHHQIESFVKNCKNGTLDAFYKITVMDPRTVKIINTLSKMKYTILYAEYKVGDKNLKLGTGVDLVCQNADGEIVLLEIKTGGERYYTPKDAQRMKKPFNMLDTSPWSQHQLQLLATKKLFEITTGIKPKHCYVWLVNSSPNPIPYELHPQLEPMGYQLLELLSKDVSKKEKKKLDVENYA
jgi:hypothetical protein